MLLGLLTSAYTHSRSNRLWRACSVCSPEHTPAVHWAQPCLQRLLPRTHTCGALGSALPAASAPQNTHTHLCCNGLRLLTSGLQPRHSLAVLPRLGLRHLLNGPRVHGLRSAQEAHNPHKLCTCKEPWAHTLDTALGMPPPTCLAGLRGGTCPQTLENPGASV